MVAKRNVIVKTTVVNRRRRRGRRNRVAGGRKTIKRPALGRPARFTAAPVAIGLRGRRRQPASVYKSTCLKTSDLLNVIDFGTLSNTVVYNEQIAPQLLPEESRGKLYSRTFAKYRVKSLIIRVETTLGSNSGGQYFLAYDPNPVTNWAASSKSNGALTSLPIQDIAAGWERLQVNVPASELEQNFELFTQETTTEGLVTRVGQIIVLVISPPSTTPPGSGQFSVWLDAEWEFYEPNATSALAAAPNVLYPAGGWNVLANGTVQPFGGVQGIPGNAYRVFPALADTLFTVDFSPEFIAFGVSGGPNAALGAFQTANEALQYANGLFTPSLTGLNTVINLPATIAVPLTAPVRAIKYPYIRVKDVPNQAPVEADYDSKLADYAFSPSSLKYQAPEVLRQLLNDLKQMSCDCISPSSK